MGQQPAVLTSLPPHPVPPCPLSPLSSVSGDSCRAGYAATGLPACLLWAYWPLCLGVQQHVRTAPPTAGIGGWCRAEADGRAGHVQGGAAGGVMGRVRQGGGQSVRRTHNAGRGVGAQLSVEP